MKVVYTTSPKEVEHLLSKGYKIAYICKFVTSTDNWQFKLEK